MQTNKLNKRVLKLWYIRATIVALAVVGVFASVAAIVFATKPTTGVSVAVLLAVGIPVVIILGFTLIMPALRYKMYEWGYDDKRIIVKQGVIFRQRVVIPICQIQDLHRTQGPLMIMLKLSGVTISTAGSNFNLSTLTTAEADDMIDQLERNLEIRIEELKNEEV